MTNDKPGSLARAHALAQIRNSEVAARIAQDAADRTRRIAPKRVDPPAEQPEPGAARPDSFLQAITRRLRG